MRVRSTVKWFSSMKGFGFSEAVESAGGKEVFLHQRRIRRERPGEYVNLDEGGRIEFDLIDEGNGPLADDIVSLD